MRRDAPRAQEIGVDRGVVHQQPQAEGDPQGLVVVGGDGREENVEAALGCCPFKVFYGHEGIAHLQTLEYWRWKRLDADAAIPGHAGCEFGADVVGKGRVDTPCDFE